MCGASVRGRDWEIEVSGANADDVEKVAASLSSKIARNDKKAGRSPWISGSFYLVAIVITIGVLLVFAKTINPMYLPVVIIGAILALSVIGALQLRQDNRLNETNFLKLMLMVFKQIPFMGKSKPKDDKEKFS